MSAEVRTLNIWRLHDASVRLDHAESTLKGTANADGVKYCGPFRQANSLGWWVFSGFDIDIIWRGHDKFEHKLYQPYPATDYKLVKGLCRPEDDIEIERFCPPRHGRTKLSWGQVEDNVFQFWSGCIFQTSPGWCLHVRDPVNFSGTRPFRLMEGILETDWMYYDIWFNLVFTQKNRWARIRKESCIPLAQLLPIRRDTFDSRWEVDRDQTIGRGDPEAEKIFSYWLKYNRRKFCGRGNNPLSATDPNIRKDSATFWKERATAVRKLDK
jgi:hypothetical protein